MLGLIPTNNHPLFNFVFLEVEGTELELQPKQNLNIFIFKYLSNV